ncbi:MAG TPA: hypothetical protein VFO64_09025, partial [Gaiellaceae bacterium]|nr:hypothetical protein [Gaiellaceae bacterium]
HDYSPAEMDGLVRLLPWRVAEREYAAFAHPGLERWFNNNTPWSYAAGPFLRLVCPRDLRTAPGPALVEAAGEGVVYLRLVKDVTASRADSASSP